MLDFLVVQAISAMIDDLLDISSFTVCHLSLYLYVYNFSIILEVINHLLDIQVLILQNSHQAVKDLFDLVMPTDCGLD